VLVLRQERDGVAGGEVGRGGEGKGQRQGRPPRGGGRAIGPRRRSHGAAAGVGKSLEARRGLLNWARASSLQLSALQWSQPQAHSSADDRFERVSHSADSTLKNFSRFAIKNRIRTTTFSCKFLHS
jgi:hypothetical protein